MGEFVMSIGSYFLGGFDQTFPEWFLRVFFLQHEFPKTLTHFTVFRCLKQDCMILFIEDNSFLEMENFHLAIKLLMSYWQDRAQSDQTNPRISTELSFRFSSKSRTSSRYFVRLNHGVANRLTIFRESLQKKMTMHEKRHDPDEMYRSCRLPMRIGN